MYLCSQNFKRLINFHFLAVKYFQAENCIIFTFTFYISVLSMVRNWTTLMIMQSLKIRNMWGFTWTKGDIIIVLGIYYVPGWFTFSSIFSSYQEENMGTNVDDQKALVIQTQRLIKYVYFTYKKKERGDNLYKKIVSIYLFRAVHSEWVGVFK